MADTTAELFIEALHTLESTRDAEPICAMFSEDADVGNVVAPEKFHGVDGARDFWTRYRETFETLHSSFRNRIVHGERIALEWSTEGTSPQGDPVKYDGVSILELSGEKISRFRAYFDPAGLGRQMELAGSSAQK